VSRSAFAGAGRRTGPIIAAVAMVILAGGCAVTLSSDAMVPNPPAPPAHRTERTITVAPVTSEGQPTGVALELTDQVRIGNEQFQAALVKALVASGIFRRVASAGTGDYELQAHIVSQQSQRAGGFIAASSSLVVNYRLRETSSGRQVWYETIISEDTEEGAPFTEGVPGAAKKSLAGAARQNVAEMLEKLAGKIP